VLPTFLYKYITYTQIHLVFIYKKKNKTGDPSTEVEIMMQLLYWVVHQYQNTSTALILLENWGLWGNILLTDRDTWIFAVHWDRAMRVRKKQTDNTERIQQDRPDILSNPEWGSPLTQRKKKHSHWHAHTHF